MSKKKTLLYNTIMMYVLVFSSYLFSFVSLPYQTRVLKPEMFGVITLATSIISYFQLFTDFGFILSGTQSVSENRSNLDEVSRILTRITIVKSLILIVILCVFIVLYFYVQAINQEPLLYIFTFFALTSRSFLPDYVYRGLERMTSVTIRTVFIKALFTGLIFIFIKEPSDYLYIPLLLLIGNLIAVIYSFIDLRVKFNIKFSKVSFESIVVAFKDSLPFFISRAAVSVYTITNATIIGFEYEQGSRYLGYYGGVEKIVNIGKSAFAPVADSLYPYMIKNRDYRLIKKIILVLLPLVLLGFVIGFVFSKELIIFILGNDYEYASLYFRYFLPVLAIIPFTYILGFPILSPLGVTRHANYSTYIGTMIQLIGLVVFALTSNINIVNIIILTGLSEFSVLIYRIIIIYLTQKNKIRQVKNNKTLEGDL